ncbi:hypothetical protein [Bradyrhizobium roseum]|uniref:hypothetical protein n=1 Tax=Bradyrhizobium roseum TaxID=3056648 RepID=UPI002603DA28|nr:hypothetical protein [Bradyrhizobium roseus]WKA31061.1 hypothetical protein QUH67_13170 [Bradyrhizobium roseus]
MKSRTRKILLGIFAPILAALAVVTYAISSFMEEFGRCETNVIGSIPSPNNKMELVTFSRECNATVGFNTLVSVSYGTLPFSPDRNPSFLSVSQRRSILLRWVSDGLVEVVLPPDVTIYRRDTEVGDVRIDYK